MWLALPGPERLVDREALLDLVRDEVNVKSIELIGDESDLVDRRVKPLLPKIGKKLGAAIPAVMAAAREGRFEILADGSVRLGRRHSGSRRSGDPGHAAARHRRRPRRGPGRGHRHRADGGTARRGRRPRAAAGDPGCPQGCRSGAGRRGSGPSRCAAASVQHAWRRISGRSRPRRGARSSSGRFRRRRDGRWTYLWTPERRGSA